MTVTIYQYDDDLNYGGQVSHTFKSQAEKDNYELAGGESYLPFVAVYTADDNNEFTGSKLVRNDYTVGDHESLTKPTDGLYQPITLAKGADGDTWTGTEQSVYEAAKEAEMEAYYAEHPDERPVEDTTQQDLADMAYQQMTDEATISDLQKSNADLQQANADMSYAIMTGGTN